MWRERIAKVFPSRVKTKDGRKVQSLEIWKYMKQYANKELLEFSQSWSRIKKNCSTTFSLIFFHKIKSFQGFLELLFAQCNELKILFESENVWNDQNWQDQAAQKLKFSMKDFFSKCDKIRNAADLVTFTEEILNGKLHFLCSVKKLDLSYNWLKKTWFIIN